MRIRQGRPSLKGLALLGMGVALACSPATADAASMTVDCTGTTLQDALNQAVDGNVITVQEGATCSGNFTLPSQAITLEGAGAGATIDAGGTGRGLRGTNVGATTIRNLTFVHGSVAGGPEGGGAIKIDGTSTPTIADANFLNNQATGGGSGGAVDVNSSGAGTVTIRNSRFGSTIASEKNSAQLGGGLFISSTAATILVENSTFHGNSAALFGGGMMIQALGTSQATITGSTFEGNTIAGYSFGGGGGAWVQSTGDANQVTITGNTFKTNHITPGAGASSGSFGAGLVVRNGSGQNGLALMSGNAVTGNVIEEGSATDFDPQGAGFYAFGVNLTSTADRFVGNTIAAPRGAGKSEGGGIFISGCMGSPTPPAVLDDAVVAGNIGTGSTAGAGIYVGCAEAPANLTLRNSTVAGNSAPLDTGGIWGGGSDVLTMINSIVAENSPAQLTGFNNPAITFSDLCLSGAPFPGNGNICAPPLLVDPANGDVHQTSSSPTRDAGSNADVPPSLTTDFEGDPRITDFDGNGTAIVDMGADESPAYVAPPPIDQPPQTPVPVIPIVRVPAPFVCTKPKQGRGGTLRFLCSIPDTGGIEALASYARPRRTGRAAALKLGKGRVLYARGKKRVTGGKNASLTLRPTKAARKALARRGRLVVRVVTRFTPATGKAKTQTKTITVKVRRTKKR